jgi:hypothetical protein
MRAQKRLQILEGKYFCMAYMFSGEGELLYTVYYQLSMYGLFRHAHNPIVHPEVSSVQAYVLTKLLRTTGQTIHEILTLKNFGKNCQAIHFSVR